MALGGVRTRELSSWWETPLGGGSMFRVNVYEVYRIGAAIHPLGSIAVGELIDNQITALFDAISACDDILNSRAFTFRVARSAVEELQNLLTKLIEYTDPERKFNHAGMQSRLRAAVQRLETVLADEFAIQDIYSVSQKAAYKIETLIDKGENVIPETLRPYLPDQALSDLRQAGKCLAFEIPTSVGFHVLRAAEATIKRYYEILAGSPWPHTQRDWGKYIDKLKGLGAPAELTDVMDQVKRNYRNPLMHPEHNLDLEAAISLYGVGQSLITLILREIKNRTPTTTP
jgi:hypothetical protein